MKIKIGVEISSDQLHRLCAVYTNAQSNKILDLSMGKITYSDLINPEGPYYIMRILRKIVGVLTSAAEKQRPTDIITPLLIWAAYREISPIAHGDDVFSLSFRDIPVRANNEVKDGCIYVVNAEDLTVIDGKIHSIHPDRQGAVIGLPVKEE